MMMRKNVLLTGKSGTGKTTAIRSIAAELDPDSLAGFWSKEIREEGQRVGFAIETLSGKTGTLAHVNLKVGPRVSKYRVSIEDIDSIIVPEMEMARESGRLIIIDEIAKMELFSENFANEVLRCLDTGRVIGTIQERKLPFLDEVRNRNDVAVFELTIANRNRIPLQVLEFLEV
ncbi:MAG: nucleoside-triphosphatase [Candidatus Thorarchaeota archaeon]|jgi:nucleoside-triphosphatase